MGGDAAAGGRVPLYCQPGRKAGVCQCCQADEEIYLFLPSALWWSESDTPALLFG